MRNIEIVKRLNLACEEKDFDTIRQLIHPQYRLKDPQMQLNGPDEFIAFMQDCPGGRLENIRMFEDGDQVIQTLDCVIDTPRSYRMRMCEVLTIKDGKVIDDETFYDTAQVPEEVQNKKYMKKAA